VTKEEAFWIEIKKKAFERGEKECPICYTFFTQTRVSK
jgi:hypothetical protein